jgi:hypothetical protein
MKRYELIVIGAGPAGLSAAVEAARAGMNVAVFDENGRPGGQLFKQIHKFFGSKEHMAKIRGFKIGEMLLREADEAGVAVRLNATVLGIFPEMKITVKFDDHVEHFGADNIVVATGAAENMIVFDGWTKPGVIGAGAAQTLMNLYGVQPGRRAMLGSATSGFSWLSAASGGCDLPPSSTPLRASAVRVCTRRSWRATANRFYTSHTIVRPRRRERDGAVIAEVDASLNPYRY